MPFLLVLLGILGGLQTMGFLGLFLGPAVMAALIALWREWTEPEPVVRSARAVSAAERRRARGRKPSARPDGPRIRRAGGYRAPLARGRPALPGCC